MTTPERQVATAAGVVGGATMISRLLGFARDIFIAQLFGSGMAADAFFVALRIPNLLRRFMGEGTLAASFIPVFTGYWEKGEKDEAWAMAQSATWIVAAILTSIVLAGMLGTWWLVAVIAPGFRTLVKFGLTVSLTRVMFPFALFMGMAALQMGILNSLQHFFTPAIGPALFNIAVITSIFTLCPVLDPPVMGLAYGVVVGGALQMLVQVPALASRGFRLTRPKKLIHPGVVRVSRLLLPTILGLAAMQINLVVDTLLASLLAEGSVSYLYYGNRLVQFPLGVFGIAMGIAVLPTLSAQAARREMERFVETLSFAIRLVLFITIPATVGLIILRHPIVQTLFERGQFTAASTQGSAFALLFYAIGLCAFAGVKVIVPAFYSMEDTTTPMKIGVCAVGLNIVLSLLLMGPLKHGGLALATSLASLFNVFALLFIFKRRVGRLGGRRILASTLKLTASSAVMGLSAAWMAHRWIAQAASGLERVSSLATVILVGVAVYIACSYALKCEELSFLYRTFRERYVKT
ncbi:MAG: murein biosynthesis integral membrane protein MurJ [bacterium]|nr:murein biosynthesis integral membrane protein MurJ [bacterium]